MADTYDITKLPERIRSKIRIAESGCWEWIAALQSDGYGSVRFLGTPRLAHRVVYTLLVAEIPSGLEIDHLCRFRKCVNPAHLEPVTDKVNALRGWGLGGINARKTACVNGHEYTPENIIHRTTGGRDCQECTRLRHYARRHGKSFAEILQDQFNPEYRRKFYQPSRKRAALARAALKKSAKT